MIQFIQYVVPTYFNNVSVSVTQYFISKQLNNYWVQILLFIF